MENEVCRAITFINYHIPIVLDADEEIPYVTIGFFDGMFTERIQVRYEEEGLKALWRYGIKRVKESMGQYSYQNIFCFSQDEWNRCSDEEFWSDDANEKYPLTFVVFLQIRQAGKGQDYIVHQCRAFSEAINNKIEGRGIGYTYCTIDKNDFVVCLKCRDYTSAVSAIKNLHGTEAQVLYSYSVFSMSSAVLKHLHEKKYADVFEKKIDSICLKGIINSYDPMHKATLDRKYFQFCNELADRLYDDKENEDYKIYDILGDDDFRFIAREVKFGKLMQQFAPNGFLSYRERKFRFYLFSSSLVLNTLTDGQEVMDEEEIKTGIEYMQQEFQAPLCGKLEKKMLNIKKTFSENRDGKFDNERAVTFCNAIWQLLQSLKALEIAPARKYDFWSLFQPLSLMVEILEKRMEEENHSVPSADSNIDEKCSTVDGHEEIYNFIHKISMAMHGTLRTDIQFFQIRDFNVVVHYAPAKLRAFYSLWALRFSDYYNDFCPQKNQYSFIFTAGMFKKISVRQLFKNYDESQRLMLITAPERNLYAVRWFSIILAHEVSHFVGYEVRNREIRHKTWIKGCARVLQLEMNYYRYVVSGSEWQGEIKCGIPELTLLKQLQEQLMETEKAYRTDWPHTFHSENSFETIRKAFRSVSDNYMEKMISDDCERMNIFLQKENNSRMAGNVYGTGMKWEEIRRIEEIRKLCMGCYKPLLIFQQRFQSRALNSVLKLFRYVDTEAYADLNAVLSLGLTPEEYIFSFVKGELDSYAKGDKLNILIIVRIALAMHTVQKIVRADSVEQVLGKKFCSEWPEDIFVKLPHKFLKDSVEYLIAVDVYGYVKDIRDCNQSIEKYESLYNYTEEVQDFVNRELGFFMDKLIWDYMTDYLNKCAEKYIFILKEKKELQKMRLALAETYEKIGRGSVSSLAQEIDVFLAKYEREMNENKD